MKHFLPEEVLIDYVKAYLKTRGFKKKNKKCNEFFKWKEVE